LGGVVFKQALVLASAQEDYYGELLGRIRGVVFMGTPHRGSRTAGPMLHLSNIINTFTLGGAIRVDLLKALRVSSKSLEEISTLSLQSLEKLSIISFYEQKPLGVSLIVEPFSAILGTRNERAIPVNADHREIAQVSPRKEQRYLTVWSAIAELIDGMIY
jgi:ankyrin repeat domain-containing protein 50